MRAIASKPPRKIARRSAGEISVIQPPMWYGGWSVGTRPSTFAIT